MFVMKPDTFDAYFEVCTDEKEQFIPPLVYDLQWDLWIILLDKIKYPIVVPVLS